jgi:hypothetical protein
LTQEEREERRRAAEMETAVRLQREREEAEAARAEQLRKEVTLPHLCWLLLPQAGRICMMPILIAACHIK